MCGLVPSRWRVRLKFRLNPVTGPMLICLEQIFPIASRLRLAATLNALHQLLSSPGSQSGSPWSVTGYRTGWGPTKNYGLAGATPIHGVPRFGNDLAGAGDENCGQLLGRGVERRMIGVEFEDFWQRGPARCKGPASPAAMPRPAACGYRSGQRVHTWVAVSESTGSANTLNGSGVTFSTARAVHVAGVVS